MGSLSPVSRRCERPACSEVAVVAYRFDAARLLVELLGEFGEVGSSGALCRRHADALVVPRGWTLDDQRDPTPRLFRVDGERSGRRGSSAAARPATNRRRRPSRETNEESTPDPSSTPTSTAGPAASSVPPSNPEPVPLGSEVHHPRRRKRRLVPQETVAALFPEPEAEPETEVVTVAELAGETPGEDLDETRAMPWSPNFDLNDTLDGTLDATTPLLGRAFTGRRRPD